MYAPYQDLRLCSARKTSPRERTRALTTIYGARLSKIKRKKMRTAVEERSEINFKNDISKNRLSPFRPLPAIGKMASESRLHDKTKDTKVIVFDITRNDQEKKLQEVLKPLTPLRVNGCHRKMSTVSLDSKQGHQQLLRENTYDVIKPLFLSAPKVKKRDSSLPRRTPTPMVQNVENYSEDNNNNRMDGPSTEADRSTKESARSRFRKAAMEIGKLSSVPETGKLLCLRQKVNFQPETEEDRNVEDIRSDFHIPVSPTQKLSKLSEIFQCLEVKGRHRDKMKLENNWF